MFWSPVSLGDPKKIPKNPKCLTASSVPAPQKSPDPNRKGSSSNRLVFRGVHFIREATESGQLAVCLVGEIVKIPSVWKIPHVFLGFKDGTLTEKVLARFNSWLFFYPCRSTNNLWVWVTTNHHPKKVTRIARHVDLYHSVCFPDSKPVSPSKQNMENFHPNWVS